VSTATPGDLERRLRTRNGDAFIVAVNEAVALGVEGDRLLTDLGLLPGWRRLYLVAALGEARGPHGGAPLREAIDLRGPGTSDLRSAALLALAKREHEGASAVLAANVDDADTSVRDYAILGLAAFGDARAWDAVARRLEATLARRRARSGEPSAVTTALCYLLRHPEDQQRIDGIATLLRRRWDYLFDNERRWLAQYWPGLDPTSGQPSPVPRPDPSALHRWILDEPLFSGTALL
jgi:hypothetical protein